MFIVRPATEKARSEGALVAGMVKIHRSNLALRGKIDAYYFHSRQPTIDAVESHVLMYHQWTNDKPVNQAYFFLIWLAI